MKEKEEEMKQIYNNLNEENKKVLNIVAKGIEIGQQNVGIEVNKND